MNEYKKICYNSDEYFQSNGNIDGLTAFCYADPTM